MEKKACFGDRTYVGEMPFSVGEQENNKSTPRRWAGRRRLAYLPDPLSIKNLQEFGP